MTRWFLIAAFACLVPMLFMPMNVVVYPVPKLVCEIGFAAFLALAQLNYFRSRGRRA